MHCVLYIKIVFAEIHSAEHSLACKLQLKHIQNATDLLTKDWSRAPHGNVILCTCSAFTYVLFSSIIPSWGCWQCKIYKDGTAYSGHLILPPGGQQD